jgi:thiosulfate/3-mercaptopyruvate sulfurtransferase
MYTTLISVTQLKDLLGSGQACMFFDCSFELGKPLIGEQQYKQSHIAGAVRADLDRHLSAAESAADAASGGRHPLPSRETFATWLGSVGFHNQMQAVVYDRQVANYCGRLWWMLKWVGHENVAVLDGGMQAWLASAGAIESGVATPCAAAKFCLTAEKTTLATAAQVANRLGRPEQSLIDARGAPRFRGEVEPLDPVAGHIPGALNRPFGQNFDSEGRFKPAHQLRAEFDALLGQRDPATVVHHCGSGVSAVPNIIAMEVAGLGRSALYAGSWSEWCSDVTRPVAQG